MSIRKIKLFLMIKYFYAFITKACVKNILAPLIKAVDTYFTQ